MRNFARKRRVLLSHGRSLRFFFGGGEGSVGCWLVCCCCFFFSLSLSSFSLFPLFALHALPRRANLRVSDLTAAAAAALPLLLLLLLLPLLLMTIVIMMGTIQRRLPWPLRMDDKIGATQKISVAPAQG